MVFVERLRSDETPAGLTNMGATCYANSILQCLYMNERFRRGIFSVEPEVSERDPVFKELSRLFALLSLGNMAVVDTSRFVTSLGLNSGAQQDSHEFLLLLLSRLSLCLIHSQATTLISDLFRGSVSHIIRCSRCGKHSEASSNITDFYELPLNVKGLTSLDESLDDYLSDEELHGDNQYFCESCKTRVDATRSTKLRTLPTVLSIQLKRYVFIPEKKTKKKLTSAFIFPGVLDMKHRLSEPSQTESTYDLSAVLIHKGTQVNSGHYVAHIKDEKTGQWWKFDDEHVLNMGTHPLGERTSSGDVDTYSSDDAYMLVYTLRHSMKCDTGSGSSPPLHLCEEIKSINAVYLTSCQQYKFTEEEMNHKVRSISSEEPSILDKPSSQCLHKKVPASKVACLKRLAAAAWTKLFSKHSSESSEYPPVLECLPCPVSDIDSKVHRSNGQSAAQATSLFHLRRILDKPSSQCLHKKVPASKVACLKRLAAAAWTKLFSKHSSESSECPPVLECLPSPVSDIDSKVYQSNDPSAAQAPSLFHSRRSRISHCSSRRRDHRGVDPGALSTGDYMAIAGAASSLVLVTVGKPTDIWFSPSQMLTSCICNNTGAARVCNDCNPYPFFIFEGWLAGIFSLSTIVIVGLYWRRGRSPIAVFHALVGVPFFYVSVYQSVPYVFRSQVLMMDTGLFVLAVFIWIFYWFARRWARRARYIPL